MRAIAFVLLFTVAAGAQPREEEVRYASDVPLAGVLLLPGVEGPWPGAVIVHGSGASDRTNTWARDVAELFVARGIAVLLTDKRGSGKSGGDWRLAGFEELSADALAGVKALASRRDIDAKRIGLIGLSQGGWIVPLAAAGRSEVAFVVDLSGATLSFAEQSFLEMANTARQAGVDAGQILELNSAAGRYMVSGRWEDYAAARAKAMKGAAKKVAAGFPESRDAPVWTFLRKVAAYDPIPYWMLLEQPVFVGFGSLDEKDNVPVAESVRRLEWVFRATGKRNYEIVVAPGVGHALMNERHEFAPEITDALSRWVAKQVLRD